MCRINPLTHIFNISSRLEVKIKILSNEPKIIKGKYLMQICMDFLAVREDSYPYYEYYAFPEYQRHRSTGSKTRFQCNITAVVAGRAPINRYSHTLKGLQTQIAVSSKLKIELLPIFGSARTFSASRRLMLLQLFRPSPHDQALDLAFSADDKGLAFTSFRTR